MQYKPFELEMMLGGSDLWFLWVSYLNRSFSLVLISSFAFALSDFW